MKTIVDFFNDNVDISPNKNSLILLNDRGELSQTITFKELQHKIHTVAGYLQQKTKKGDRALLLYRTGVDFIVSFMACQYIGVIAVPMSLYSQKSAHFQRVQYILEDAAVKTILTSQNLREEIETWSEKPTIPCIATDQIKDVQCPTEIQLCTHDIAFLQYTSGSTGDPKGVMVSHGNLMHNSALIKHKYQHDADTIMGGWLPFYHDMGLIGLILQSLYLGCSLVLMSPIAFVKNPMNWLKAISHYKITTSGGPNFSFEHCVKQFNPQKIEGIDLSHWRTCFNGAEPIRKQTIDSFAELFAQYGFKKHSFYPCYGMAEATLFVTGGKSGVEYRTLYIDPVALALNNVLEKQSDKAIPAVSSGWSYELDVMIVDPSSKQKIPENKIGEIWVSGDSVAQGYWGKTELSKEVFQAQIIPSDGKYYLRTGDLGFLNRNELFVTGRIKDLIIINGRNIYPQDIEEHIHKIDPLIFKGQAAAFSLEVDQTEHVVIVQEIENRKLVNESQFKEIKNKIQSEVGMYFQIPIASIDLIPRGSLPRTTSGKVQRRKTKDSWLNGKLPLLTF